MRLASFFWYGTDRLGENGYVKVGRIMVLVVGFGDF